jgi:hypothetical protein
MNGSARRAISARQAAVGLVRVAIAMMAPTATTAARASSATSVSRMTENGVKGPSSRSNERQRKRASGEHRSGSKRHRVLLVPLRPTARVCPHPRGTYAGGPPQLAQSTPFRRRARPSLTGAVLHQPAEASHRPSQRLGGTGDRTSLPVPVSEEGRQIPCMTGPNAVDGNGPEVAQLVQVLDTNAPLLCAELPALMSPAECGFRWRDATPRRNRDPCLPGRAGPGRTTKRILRLVPPEGTCHRRGGAEVETLEGSLLARTTGRSLVWRFVVPLLDATQSGSRAFDVKATGRFSSRW